MGTLEVIDPSTFKPERSIQLYVKEVFEHQQGQLINKNFQLLTEGNFLYFIGKRIVQQQMTDLNQALELGSKRSTSSVAKEEEEEKRPEEEQQLIVREESLLQAQPDEQINEDFLVQLKGELLLQYAQRDDKSKLRILVVLGALDGVIARSADERKQGLVHALMRKKSAREETQKQQQQLQANLQQQILLQQSLFQQTIQQQIGQPPLKVDQIKSPTIETIIKNLQVRSRTISFRSRSDGAIPA